MVKLKGAIMIKLRHLSTSSNRPNVAIPDIAIVKLDNIPTSMVS